MKSCQETSQAQEASSKKIINVLYVQENTTTMSAGTGLMGIKSTIITKTFATDLRKKWASITKEVIEKQRGMWISVKDSFAKTGGAGLFEMCLRHVIVLAITLIYLIGLKKPLTPRESSRGLMVIMFTAMRAETPAKSTGVKENASTNRKSSCSQVWSIWRSHTLHTVCITITDFCQLTINKLLNTVPEVAEIGTVKIHVSNLVLL